MRTVNGFALVRKNEVREANGVLRIATESADIWSGEVVSVAGTFRSGKRTLQTPFAVGDTVYFGHLPERNKFGDLWVIRIEDVFAVEDASA